MLGQLGAVIGEAHGRATATGDDGIEFAHDPQAGQRSVGDQRQAFAGEVIDDAKDAERRPSVKASDTKSRLQRWFGPCGIVIGALVPSARLRPEAPADLQPFLTIEPAQLLVVHDQALAAHQDMQAR